MATATEPKKADAAGYVDFDEFIEYQLTRTRNGIKSTDLLTALIGGAAVVLGYVLVFALFDHWIVDGGFSTTTRVVLLSLLVLGLVGWTVWKLVLPYFRTVTPLYAARQIEQTQPDLQYSLLTLVDLKRAGRPVPESIEAALEKRSALNLSEMDIEEAVDRRVLMRLSYVLFVLVVLTCAYVLFSPKKLSNSLWRALLPASSVSVATRTRIDDVAPGDVELLARSQLTVTADLSGEVPKDVTLLFSTADRRFVDEPVAMRQTDEGLRRFSGVITGENGAGILQNLTYRVQAGDAQSNAYVVTVKQPPSATVQEVAFEYPSYMGLDPRTQSGGAIDSWEGTWVTIRAKANMPLTSAMVLFSDSEDTSQKAEEFPAEITGGVDITARWQLRIRSDGTHPAFYRIQCRNEDGETDIDPTLYPVKIRPDLPPRIELAQPTGDIERPANAIVPLLYAAQDQDFLLRSVVLHMELNGDAIPQQPRLYQAPPFRKSVHDVHNLELAALNLSPGDRLTYWLEARDNMEPFADRSGNRAVTPKLNITITEPASPEQVQEQLEEDQQQVADKLEQARQQEDAAPDEPQDQSEMEEATPPPAPNDDRPSEPGDEAQPTETGETEERSTGQAGGADEQQQGRGEGQSQSSPTADGERGGEQQAGGSERAEDGTSESGQQQDGEEAFDDLLKELIQRDQQRQRENGGEQPPQDGQQQPSPAGSQQPQDRPPQDGGQQPPGETPQPGQTDAPPTGEQPPQPGEAGSQQPSSQQPSQAGEMPSDSPSQQAGDSPEAMDQQPSTGRGTDPASPAESPGADAAQPTPGETPGGEPTPDPNATPPQGQRPSDAPPTADGQKQPGADPAGAKPGEASADNESTQPRPDAQQPPDSLSDQPGPKPGEATQQPDAKSGGQPDGPDEPMQGPGEPDGQRSERPQTGEGGSSQQTSQGNQGGNQQGPGDSTGQPGGQEASPQQGGQPGSEKPGAGSEQQPGGQQPGGQSPDAGGQQPAGEQTGQSPSGDDRSTPGGGQQGDMPQMQGDAPSQAPAQGTGEEPGREQQTGEPQDAGGQQETGGQQGGQQSGESPSGEGGQQGGQQPGGEAGGQQGGEGMSQSSGEAGAPPSGGSPSGPGSGARSDGGEAGPAGPDGQAGGGERPVEGGDGTAGESSDQAPMQDEADLEAKKQAANLVLQRLQEQLQRGEVDPDLQRDLNLTPERLQEFTQKLEQRLAETSGDDTSPDAQARRRQFEETLRNIDFDSTGTTREGGDGPREASGGFSGPTREAPPQLREAARLYRERMLRQQRSSQR